jgi:hypothetical protein
MQQGVMIRCERHEGKFFMNGKLVKQWECEGNIASDAVPTFACTGKVRVARIELGRICPEQNTNAAALIL